MAVARTDSWQKTDLEQLYSETNPENDTSLADPCHGWKTTREFLFYLADEAFATELADHVAVVYILEVLAEVALALELNPAGQARHRHVQPVHCIHKGYGLS